MNKIARKIGVAVIALVTIVSVSGITPAFAQATPAFNFTRNLTVGSTGEDVRALQQFLNARGFAVATVGAGSPGNETTRFGPRTQAALARFQVANNISPARGFFGPITRARVIALITPVTTTPVFNFTRDLSLGSTGEDVRALQRFLNARGFTIATTGPGSPGNETTFFDFPTQSALTRFQTTSNISPANGLFDSTTRARVIALITPGATDTPVTTTPVTAGTLFSAISPTTPVSAIVPVGTTGRADVPITTVRFTTTNEPIILQDITITQTGTAPRTAMTSIEIVDGDRIISVPVPATGDIIFRDANIEIPTPGHRDIIFRADLAGIGHAVTSGQTVKLDVNVTRARGRNSNANVPTGLGGLGAIVGGNLMTIRQTIPTVTIDSAANLDSFAGLIEYTINREILRINVTADAGGDVFLREISIVPTITKSFTPSGETRREITVVQRPVDQTTPKGRVTHLTITNRVPLPDSFIPIGGIIPIDIIRIPLTGAIIPRGTTSSFSVFSSLNIHPAFFDSMGKNTVQVKISPDASAGITGNFVWGEGTDTPNINGHLIGGLPINGPTVNWMK